MPRHWRGYDRDEIADAERELDEAMNEPRRDPASAPRPSAPSRVPAQDLSKDQRRINDLKKLLDS